MSGCADGFDSSIIGNVIRLAADGRNGPSADLEKAYWTFGLAGGFCSNSRTFFAFSAAAFRLFISSSVINCIALSTGRWLFVEGGGELSFVAESIKRGLLLIEKCLFALSVLKSVKTSLN